MKVNNQKMFDKTNIQIKTAHLVETFKINMPYAFMKIHSKEKKTVEKMI